ncbi:hypothetical protein BN1195_04011 [Chryseobacterium oranimense G311]|uniref:hypothetical protein n=1 Tax=Chryseobacterium oranimense TaxID=421058 RepID=UPI000533A414|nr:hypothetical protein [Chryseobacterium oranimense]CEJ71661.1 hypothetical protein BN1195_04011 [Chryseobacterium oranimense G311]
MKKNFTLSLLMLGMAVFGQSKEDSIQFSKISTEILNNGKGYTDLKDLTKNIGNRLSGTVAYEKSVKWAEQKLREAGADKVWLQEVMIQSGSGEKNPCRLKPQTDSGRN